MEVLDINTFLSYKTKEETQELDSKTVEFLYSLFGSSDKNKNKDKKIKKINILKNHKIQNSKDSINNKVNLILNKLSESNVDNLIIEFLDNINQVDEEQYNEIQKSFYLKMVAEINFIKIYLYFLKIISILYNKVQNYNLSFFISIIESKFKLDYNNIELNEQFQFIKELNEEQKRVNNLIIIKHMVDSQMLSKELVNDCTDIILAQNNYLPDVYHWFNCLNRKVTILEKEKIKVLLDSDNISQREFVLLENLMNDKKEEKVVHNVISNNNNNNNNNTIIKTDTLLLEIENIIEEFLMIKSLDDVKHFLGTRCTDAISKNKFCEFVINKYFCSSKSIGLELLDLCNNLTKDQSLFKSNISRGLILINNNWKDKSNQYTKGKEKMVSLLNYLKKIGITKSIEFIFDNYKINL